MSRMRCLILQKTKKMTEDGENMDHDWHDRHTINLSLLAPKVSFLYLWIC